MVFECPYPASILDRDNRRYCSAYPSWTLAFSIDIPRLYSAGYSGFDFGMARKDVELRRLGEKLSRRRRSVLDWVGFLSVAASLDRQRPSE
jgi:hypothetical protein